MKKLILILTVLFTSQFLYAKNVFIKCIEPSFKPYVEKTTININLENKTLSINSVSRDYSFKTGGQLKETIKSITLENIDCDIPDAKRGIFWCRFNGYNRNGKPLTHGKLEKFNGKKLDGIFAGHINGVAVTRAYTKLGGGVKISKLKEMSIFLSHESGERETYKLSTNAFQCVTSLY